jgi:hypothetical protein
MHTMIHGALSDLFFNYEHPRRDALYGTGTDKWPIVPTEEVERAALVEDAVDFLDTVRPILMPDVLLGVTPESLADDFLNRL